MAPLLVGEPHQPVLQQVLTNVGNIQDSQPADLLSYALWTNWLDHAPLKRSELFEVTDKLCAAAIQLTGNPQAANEIARAVMDVATWWP